MTRVLVVDDKEENLYYLTALLEGHRYEVESAHHGAEALLKARRSLPDLIISDLLMPVMDGYSLLRQWKADPRLSKVPFIVYTATYTDPEDKQLAQNLGADAFILKPCEPDDFLTHVREVERTTARPPPSQPTRGEADLLREYSSSLIRKLEEKTLQLEESNRQLQEDIAQRTRAESALRESEERFRQLAESVEEVFWLLDLDTSGIIYVSPAFDAVWGTSRERLLEDARSWLDAVHPDDRPHLLASLSDYDSGRWNEAYRIVRPDGQVRWLRSHAYPVKDARGRVYRVANLTRDISEYRRLEDQFRQAQKMEAVGRLAGGMAHDFNNILSVILTFAQLGIEQLPPEAPVRSDLEEIRHAGERAAELIRQLLALSRQQVLEPRVLDPREVVQDTERMLRRLLREDIELLLVTSRASDKVYVDRSQLEQIIMNLTVNARDAMPSGGKLTIELSNALIDRQYAASNPGLKAGPHVLLTVTDNGIGMDAATREHIFEPFFTTKEMGKGTGLGLATVLGIVQQSHGHIHVYSEPGVGSCFKIYLPSTDRPLEEPPRMSAPPETLRGTETILLVEDDDQVRATHRAILDRKGYRVIGAADGEAALAASAAFEGKIHLLLTDVVMPKLSGRQVAERLTELRPDMPVLFVSGYTEDSIVHHGLLDAGIHYLPKPIAPQALLRKVREMLDAAAAPEQHSS